MQIGITDNFEFLHPITDVDFNPSLFVNLLKVAIVSFTAIGFVAFNSVCNF